MTGPDARQDYIAALAEAHGFSPDELADNRAGRLHPRQVARLGSAGLGGTVTAVAFALLSFAGGLGGAYLFYDDVGRPFSELSSVDRNAIYGIAGVGVVLGLVFAAGVVSSVRKRRRLRARASDGVQRLEGAMRKLHVQGRGGMPSEWYYEIEGLRFAVVSKQYDLVTHGARYRVYHVGGMLLAIEPG